jgi:hypothetical protein
VLSLEGAQPGEGISEIALVALVALSRDKERERVVMTATVSGGSSTQLAADIGEGPGFGGS